jgi:glutamate synthase domain-containing protein 2
VTKQMHQEQAQQVAAELNAEFAQQVALHESVSRKHFEQVVATVKAIEDPQKRQAHADHHAAIFASQNPRFDHARFHATCNTVHVKKEAKQLANLPIQESLHTPLNPPYAQYLNSLNRHREIDDNQAGKDSVTHTNKVVSEWRETQSLLTETPHASSLDDQVPEPSMEAHALSYTAAKAVHQSQQRKRK